MTAIRFSGSFKKLELDIYKTIYGAIWQTINSVMVFRR